MKVCAKCKIEKGFAEFYPHNRDGYRSRCRACAGYKGIRRKKTESEKKDLFLEKRLEVIRKSAIRAMAITAMEEEDNIFLDIADDVSYCFRNSGDTFPQ